MNFLSPDDIFSGVRRKSVCNGSLLTLSGKGSSEGGSSTSKNKKERRRGSFNEPILISGNSSTSKENGGRRASLVSRWFKHISDAAEQYKPRSKNANHEPVDDPAIATLPHSNTRESLEITPERPPPQSATATVITTPLAPIMLPIPGSHNDQSGFSSHGNDVQMRNGRRESTPGSAAATASDSYPPYYNIKQRLSHNELSANGSVVNRTMSTRSCGDANHNYSNTADFAGANGVTLRHTQSARQANGSGEDTTSGTISSKRDSASIVYSNNSNNTRTLMQSSPPLVEPTAIQISISPAHTAEPVLTPAEKLRRLDVSIRDGLLEKQKIICDMFRLPVEHFHEIVDIAAMPEAPKDSTDIALAAYAQVQSLTEVINEYMKVTPEQEVSAVSTAVCDICHEKQQQIRPRPPSGSGKTVSISDVPPPLPPPNKQTAQPQQQTPAPLAAKIQMCALEETSIHEDDDGYCEIDELRLPALPPLIKTTAATVGTTSSSPPITKTTAAKKGSPPPPLPTPAGSFKTPPPPPPPPPTEKISTSADSSSVAPATTPELIKRQSTISADSIPEESADEVTDALKDRAHDDKNDFQNNVATPLEEVEKNIEDNYKPPTEAASITEFGDTAKECNVSEIIEAIAPIATIDDEDKDDDSAMHTAECESISAYEKEINEEESGRITEASDEVVKVKPSSMAAEPQKQNSSVTQVDDVSLNSEHIEVNEAYEYLSMVDNSTQTMPIITPSTPVCSNTTSPATNTAVAISCVSTTSAINGHLPTLCGPNRIQHANSLEPSVPCYALSSIVSSLNAQISLLLPKINERDMERERLRKENQHLRELLNAMHERQRVESKLETPNDITSAEAVDNEIDASSPTTSITPTPTPMPIATTSATVGDNEETNKSTITTTATSDEAQN